MTEALIIGGVVLSLLLQSGTLWHVVQFARTFGQMEQQTKTNTEDIRELRTARSRAL